MRKSVATITMIVAVLILSASKPAEAGAPLDICHHLPLFERYAAAEALGLDDGVLELRLTADHHAADCGTPDGYGTHLLVRVELRQDPVRCLSEDVTVVRIPFNQHKDDYRAEVDRTPIGFVLDEPMTELDDEALERLVIRSRETREAIVFLPHNFFYFFDVEPGGVLHEYLHPDGEGPECCWGANSVQIAHTDW